MNKTALALATALLFAGVATTASAKHHHRYHHRHHHYAQVHHMNNSAVRDSDHDGIANRNDNHDNRWDTNRFHYTRQHVYTAVTPYSGPAYVGPSGYRYSRYQAGASLPRGYYGDPYYVEYQPYNLPPPRAGYRWNRVGNDVYMVQTTNGMIADAVYDLFH